MKLILVRHAKAMDRVKALLREIDDENRPLTKKGKLKFQAHVQAVREEFAGVELFVTSEYLRALQTLEVLLEVLIADPAKYDSKGRGVASRGLVGRGSAARDSTTRGSATRDSATRDSAGRGPQKTFPQLVLKGISPDSSADNLVKWLQTRKEKKIVVVGHEPFLSNFLSKQNKKPFKDKIKKGAVICADVVFDPKEGLILKVEKVLQPGK
jgi:phosphohistidine phosphatase SixA